MSIVPNQLPRLVNIVGDAVLVKISANSSNDGVNGVLSLSSLQDLKPDDNLVLYNWYHYEILNFEQI